MANEDDPITTNQTDPQPQEPQQQPQTDWKSEARKWESRAKEANKSKADLQSKLDEMADYADIKARNGELQKQVDEYAANAERAKAVAEAAKAHGVNAEILSRMAGDVEENAKFLESMPKYPNIHDTLPGGGQQQGITEKDIEGEKDPVKRVQMRAQLAAQNRK